jgi:hypothetical protein
MEIADYLAEHDFNADLIDSWLTAPGVVVSSDAVVTRDVIRRILETVALSDEHRDKLQGLISPSVLFNPNGVTTQDVWRSGDFDWNLQRGFSTAMRLRTGDNKDVSFDPRGFIHPEPKTVENNFPGMSLCTSDVLEVNRESVLARFPYETVVQDRSAYEKNLKAWERKFEGQKSRVKLVFQLPARSILSLADWVLDSDEKFPGHVTLAVNKATPAEGVENITNEIAIPAIQQMAWKPMVVVVLKARGESSPDFLPDDPVWSEAVQLLNVVLAEGDFEDMMLAHHCFRTVRMRTYLSPSGPLELARRALASFLRGDCCEMHHYRRFIAAIRDLDAALGRV